MPPTTFITWPKVNKKMIASHRISGKTPIEDVVETMKEFVLYVRRLPCYQAPQHCPRLCSQ